MLKIHNKNFGWKKVFNLTTACLTLFFSVVFFGNVFAQDITQNDIQKGLTLSPIRKELKINPGTVVEGFLSITNSTDKTVVVNLRAEEFSVINEKYDYSFAVESDIAKWVTFNTSEITLLGGQSSELKYSIDVPISAEPGGKYISLFASTDSDSSSGIKSKQRIASLLYITILGNISQTGSLKSLSLPWLIFDNGEWNASLKNTGTAHFVSQYNVDVENPINSQIISSASGEAMILPGTTRLVTESLPTIKWPGIYKIVYKIELGDTPVTNEIRYILYLPLLSINFIIAVAIILAIICCRHRNKK